VKPTIHIDDRAPGWKKLKATLMSLQRGDSYVKVGLLGEKAAAEEHEGEPLTNVELAAAHEFGTEDLPERSFIRRSFDENRDAYYEQLSPLVAGVYEGRVSIAKALEIMGHRIKWDMKNLIIENRIEPPDAPGTIARKAAKSYHGAAAGSPVTLVDSGKLVAAIDHAVVLGGEEHGVEKQIGSATLTGDET